MTVQTATIPDAIDWLLKTVRALPECAAPVYVFDGMPDSNPDVMVVIGGTSEPVTAGARVWASLGGPSGVPSQDETYSINCFVSAFVGGGTEAQKPARDATFEILRAIEVAVRDDPKMGGLLGTGWTSFGVLDDVYQTSADSEEVSKGRICTVQFHIEVFSRLRS